MFELAIRVVFSLAAILGLLWFVARTSSRRLGGGSRSAIKVVARQPLARTASLAIVEVGERVLVVGVSEHGISLLTEMEPGELPEPEVVEPVVRTPRPSSQAALGGSVISPQTWRQAWAAATSKNGSASD